MGTGNSVPRRSTVKGRATIAVDFRTVSDGNADTADYAPLQDVIAFLDLVRAIGGPTVEVFFDFGCVSIRNVDLKALRLQLDRGGD